MLPDDVTDLAKLVRLALALNRLEIDWLGNAWMLEPVVAAPYMVEGKPKTV